MSARDLRFVVLWFCGFVQCLTCFGGVLRVLVSRDGDGDGDDEENGWVGQERGDREDREDRFGVARMRCYSTQTWSRVLISLPLSLSLSLPLIAASLSPRLLQLNALSHVRPAERQHSSSVPSHVPPPILTSALFHHSTPLLSTHKVSSLIFHFSITSASAAPSTITSIQKKKKKNTLPSRPPRHNPTSK